MQKTDSEWYQTNWGIILLIMLIFPVGIYFMWKYAGWNKYIKYSLTGVASIYVLAIMVIAAVSPPEKSKNPPQKKPSSQTASKPKATYEASISAQRAVDPATVLAVVHIKNTSTISGKPSCFVSVSNSSNVYKGYDTFNIDKTLAPNEEYNFSAKLTVTKEGAAYVTRGTVSCS